MTGVFVLSFQKSCDGVTLSEISGQELSLTTSQTESVSWLFEVSVNVGVTECVCVWECVWVGGGEEGQERREGEGVTVGAPCA